MKVLHLSYSDWRGGAAKAAHRLHLALRRSGVDSYMLVVDKGTDDPAVMGVTKAMKARIMLAQVLAKRILKLQSTENSVIHSLNLFPSGIGRVIDQLCPDVVHLHWVNGEMISIREIGRIGRPVIWTMHDMWPFSGAEHYDDLKSPGRYGRGYSSESRPGSYTGPDLDRLCFKRKVKPWRKLDVRFVSPSRWLAECAKNSSLVSGADVTVVPNCLDEHVFRPLDRRFCQAALNLPQDKTLLLFGAMSSTTDSRKGYHLLRKAMARLYETDKDKLANVELVVFGASHGNIETELGARCHYLGQLLDDHSLALAYNACHFFVAPSEQDNLPNTVLEAQACGTACIAFNLGGMPDLICSDDRGALVKPLDACAFADAISNTIMNQQRGDYSSRKSLLFACADSVVEKYSRLYGEACQP